MAGFICIKKIFFLNNIINLHYNINSKIQNPTLHLYNKIYIYCIFIVIINIVCWDVILSTYLYISKCFMANILLANLSKAISYKVFKWYIYRLKFTLQVCFSWLVNDSDTVKTLAIVAKLNFALVFGKCAVCSFKLCCSCNFERFHGKMLFLLIIVTQFEDLDRPVATFIANKEK